MDKNIDEIIKENFGEGILVWSERYWCIDERMNAEDDDNDNEDYSYKCFRSALIRKINDELAKILNPPEEDENIPTEHIIN